MMTPAQDKVRQFLRDTPHFTLSEKSFTPIALLHDSFGKWLQSKGGKPLSIFQFSRALASLNLPIENGHKRGWPCQCSHVKGVCADSKLHGLWLAHYQHAKACQTIRKLQQGGSI